MWPKQLSKTCTKRHHNGFCANTIHPHIPIGIPFPSLSIYYSVIQLNELERQGQNENTKALKRRRRGLNPGLPRLRVWHSTAELPRLRVRHSTAELPRLRVLRSTAELPRLRVRRSTAELPRLRVRHSTAKLPRLRVRRSTAELPRLRVQRSTAELPRLRVRHSTAELPRLRVRHSTAELHAPLSCGLNLQIADRDKTG